jgi:hypothetical protein
MGERKKFSYRKYALEDACRAGFDWRTEITAKDCRKMIDAAKRWVQNATKTGPNDARLLDSLKQEVGEAEGRRDLAVVAGTMRVRDALIWQLRNDHAENTAVNARLIRKIESYPPRDWDRLGVALYDAAQVAIQKLRNEGARRSGA